MKSIFNHQPVYPTGRLNGLSSNQSGGPIIHHSRLIEDGAKTNVVDGYSKPLPRSSEKKGDTMNRIISIVVAIFVIALLIYNAYLVQQQHTMAVQLTHQSQMTEYYQALASGRYSIAGNELMSISLDNNLTLETAIEQSRAAALVHAEWALRNDEYTEWNEHWAAVHNYCADQLEKLLELEQSQPNQ